MVKYKYLKLKNNQKIRYKNTRGKESQGTITALEDPAKPGHVLVNVKGKTFPLSKQSISGKVNESYQYSFEYIVKKYR